MKLNYMNLRKLINDPKKIFILLIFSFIIVFAQNYVAQNPSFKAEVIRVIDGDTIEINSTNGLSKVRFFGIDAPELKQNFGKQSKEALNKILNGKQVQIFYKDKDVYGRIVAVVKLDGIDVNRFLVSKGYAWANTYYTDVYVKEQENAKKNKLGLWKEDNPIEPYKWRKRNKF